MPRRANATLERSHGVKYGGRGSLSLLLASKRAALIRGECTPWPGLALGDTDEKDKFLETLSTTSRGLPVALETLFLRYTSLLSAAEFSFVVISFIVKDPERPRGEWALLVEDDVDDKKSS